MPDAQLIAGRVASVVGMLGSLSTFAELAQDNFDAFAPAQETVSCESGGSVTRLQVDGDGNRRFSAGDSLGQVGNDCREQAEGGGTTQINGRYDVSVLAASGFPYGAGSDWNVRTRQTYSGLTLAVGGFSIRFDGSAEVEDTAKTHTYRFLDLSQSSTLTSNAIQVVSGEATLESARADGTTQGEIGVQFKDVVVRTNVSASEKVNVTVPAATASSLNFGPDGIPFAGALVLQLEKAKVVVTVLAPNQVRVDVDNNNDGSIDATQTLAWSALISAAAL